MRFFGVTQVRLLFVNPVLPIQMESFSNFEVIPSWDELEIFQVLAKRLVRI